MFVYPRGGNMQKYYESKIGLWFKTDCNDKNQFICKRNIDPKVKPVPPPRPTPGGCPDGMSMSKEVTPLF